MHSLIIPHKDSRYLIAEVVTISNSRGAYLGYSAPSVIYCIYKVSEVLSKQ